MVAHTQELNDLIDTVLGELGTDSPVGRANLSTHNADINMINAEVTERFSGQASPWH